MKKLLSVAVMTVGALLTGCSSDSRPKPAGPEGVGQSAIPASDSLAPPQALSDSGEFSENIYDLAKAGEWDKASGKMVELRDALARWQKESRAADPEMEGALSGLQEAVASKDQKAAMRLANRLTLLAAEKQRRYKPVVPVEIIKLDYYGRELEIWAAENDRRRLQETATAMEATWETVRPGVEARGGKAAASKFAALMATMVAAKSSADYRKSAAALLNQVDALEALYHPGK